MSTNFDLGSLRAVIGDAIAADHYVSQWHSTDIASDAGDLTVKQVMVPIYVVSDGVNDDRLYLDETEAEEDYASDLRALLSSGYGDPETRDRIRRDLNAVEFVEYAPGHFEAELAADREAWREDGVYLR